LLIVSAVPAQIGRDWIARHIPHHGAMCLIDSVTAWDSDTIQCATQTHTHADNPLRADGRLGALCGVEYAAQAMAIHCAILLARQSAIGGTAAAGYIAALRDVECRVDRLDTYLQPLQIVASRQAGFAGGAMYDFVIGHASLTLQTGRVTLKLAALAADDPGAAS